MALGKAMISVGKTSMLEPVAASGAGGALAVLAEPNVGLPGGRHTVCARKGDSPSSGGLSFMCSHTKFTWVSESALCNPHKLNLRLDVHKGAISYCVKDATGQVHQEGKIGSRNWDRNGRQDTDAKKRTPKRSRA